MICAVCDGELTPSGMGGRPCSCPPPAKPTLDDVRRGLCFVLWLSANGGPGLTDPTLVVSVTEGVGYGEEGASTYLTTEVVATANRPDGVGVYLELDSIADYDDDLDLFALMDALAALKRPTSLAELWEQVRG